MSDGFKPVAPGGGSSLTPEQEEAVDSIVNLPDNAVPQALGGELVVSGTNVDSTSEEWDFDKTINVPVGSVNLGNAYKLSSGGSSVRFQDFTRDEISRVQLTSVEDMGAVTTIINRELDLGGIVFQPDDSTVINEPIATTAVIPALAPTLMGGAPEDGQLVRWVDLKLDPTSETKNITFDVFIDGVLYISTFIEEVFLIEAPDIYRFFYSTPADVRVGDVFDNVFTSESGNLKLLGDNLGNPWSRIDLIFWDNQVNETVAPLQFQTSADFSVDAANNSVFVKAPFDGVVQRTYPTNTLIAIDESPYIKIQLVDGDTNYIEQLSLDGIYIDGVLVTQVVATAVSELNALFTKSADADGDMLKSVYDPSLIEDDVFSMGNMNETSTEKILTGIERSNIAGNTSAIIVLGPQVGQNVTDITDLQNNKLDDVDEGFLINIDKTDPLKPVVSFGLGSVVESISGDDVSGTVQNPIINSYPSTDKTRLANTSGTNTGDSVVVAGELVRATDGNQLIKNVDEVVDFDGLGNTTNTTLNLVNNSITVSEAGVYVINTAGAIRMKRDKDTFIKFRVNGVATHVVSCISTPEDGYWVTYAANKHLSLNANDYVQLVGFVDDGTGKEYYLATGTTFNVSKIN